MHKTTTHTSLDPIAGTGGMVIRNTMINTTIEIQQTTKLPAGYKQSALGIIPEDWEVKVLGEVTYYIKGYAFKSNMFSDKGIRIIRISDTTSNSIKDEGAIYIDSENASNYKKWELKSDDLVFTTVGSRPPMYDSMVGKVIKIEKKHEGSLLNQNAVIIRTEDIANQQFVFNQFKEKRYLDFIETIVRGNANQVSITLEDLFKYLLVFPPLQEQQKIAEILSTWDNAIDNCKKIIKKLKKRNKGLAQQLLTGKTRVKGFEDTKWQYVAINKIAKEISVKNIENKEMIVLSCTKHNGLVPSLEYFGRKIYSDDVSTYKIVKKGQFAYATNHIEEGSIGYQSRFEEALISPMYTVFETNHSINDELFFRLLKSYDYIHEYQRRMEGSIDRRGGLRWSEFSKIKVPLIDKKEQFEIEKILCNSNEELKQYEQKLANLQLQKKGLMQQLLTGKVRVKLNK